MMIKIVLIVLAATLGLVTVAAAVESPTPIQTSVGSKNDDHPDTTASQANDGRIIDSIVIDPRNIYDTKDPKYSSFIFRTANRLHLVTRPSVIRRELLFHPGEKYSSEEAEETARNLRTRYYLYDAWVETERRPNGHLVVRIVTIDQWSLVGGFNVNREGNRTKYKIGFEERNLFGLNQFVSFDYMVQEADRNYIKWVFRDSRFFGFPYMVTTEFNTDPRNEEFSFAFSKPFYKLDQPFSYGFKAGSKGGRRTVYLDADSIGAWRSNADEFDMSGEYRWGGRYQKLSLSLGYSYHRDNITEKQGAVFFPVDSLYHEPSLGLALYHNRYVRLRRVAGFSFLEDFTLTNGVAIEGARAFSITGGYFYNRISVQGTVSKQLDSSLLFLSYDRSYWLHGGTELRRFSEFVGRYYNTNLDWVTFAARFIYRSDISPAANHGVILGGTTGLRGFDEVAQTGDRLAVLNLESRFYPNLEFLSVIFGGVVFSDIGRAWARGEATKLNDMEYSVGAGLRISLEKATKSEIIRIDAAVTRYGNWGFAFGTGQYF